ncbi:hypothetical protein CQW23_15000 [Capsicum baccatum]|uniref:Uncharacterized protein n=1 Tax=Capsicum baccatum TaxID=33114 RepID=A0A2G2WKU5_CAPBA|nr:hypothetical protein CQW23_15000 [Capsicum baccatum]
MEALIPEPTPVNVKRFKKVPMLVEDAWEDDSSSHNMEQVIDHDTIMRVEDKEILKENLGISAENPSDMGLGRNMV